MVIAGEVAGALVRDMLPRFDVSEIGRASEVNQAYLVGCLVKQDVVWLEVVVYEADSVRLLYCLEYLLRNTQDLIRSELLILIRHQGVQILAIIRHDKIFVVGDLIVEVLLEKPGGHDLERLDPLDGIYLPCDVGDVSGHLDDQISIPHLEVPNFVNLAE